jgi:hypothetical protein
MKICPKCKESKFNDEFYRDSSRKNGIQSYCKICKRKQKKKYDQTHKDENWLYNREYRQKHKEERRWYENNKRKTDIQWKLRKNLRNRLSSAIRNSQKSGSAVRDLGCSIEKLKRYLERQFQPRMSWENYGQWHIDHIKPLASFDLTDRDQLLEACHYTNLQPLWAKENLKKNNSSLCPR